MAYLKAIRAVCVFAAVLGGIAEDLVCAQQPKIQNIFHSSWSSESQLSAVFDVQQDNDGYLWLTTANGMLRFDGVSFQSADDATGNAVHNRTDSFRPRPRDGVPVRQTVCLGSSHARHD